ncbi:MAG: hypothetical protein P8099_04830 [Gemmatimonadota bacterium]|jgi:hypothetical protein
MKLEQWSHWAEIAASIAIFVSLIILVQEVRYNTLVLERQAVLDRAAAFNGAFLEDSPLPSILTQIKTVDGFEPLEQALVERYDLTYEQAVRWGRHLSLLWTVLEADYRTNGPSEALGGIAYSLLGSPDNQLFWDKGAPQVTSGEFRQYVTAIRAAR